MKLNYKNRKNQRGFSLIELMIVIAIIGILIGVGVPAWRVIIRRGNETAATQTLENLRKIQADYSMGHRGEYGTFDQLIREGNLDKRFEGEKPVLSGYVYTIKITPKSTNQPASYSVNADPQVATGLGSTGKRHFYVDPNVSTIRVNDDQPASADDSPIE